MKDKVSFLTLAIAKGGRQSIVKWIGVTTTPLSDGATTNPITVNGAEVTAKNGDVAQYGNNEYIYNGEVWQDFSMEIKVENKALIFG